MKALKRILAFTMAVLMIMSLAACSKKDSVPKTLSHEWSYKTDSAEYAIGVYIFSLYSAYDNAYGIIQSAKGEEFDANASILDYQGTFDETGEVYLCSDWVKLEADRITKNLIALDEKIREYGIELDEEVVASYRQQAENDWYLGPYYEQYLAYGYSAVPYKDTFEPFGISFESFYISTYLASAKQNALFDYFYKKDGVKAVPDDEIKAFFEENYVSYSYFSIPLYTSTQDETTLETVNVSFTEEKINDNKAMLDSYVKAIKDGTSYDNVVKLYMSFVGTTTNPSKSNIENKEGVSTSIGEGVSAKLDTLKEGQAGYVIVGEGNNRTAFFIYKKPIASESDAYIKEEVNNANLLQDMKGDEFRDYVESLTDTVNPQKNTKVIDKYNPAIFEKKSEDKK